MRTSNILFSFLAIFLFSSCSDKLPKNYGVYVNINGNLIDLQPQKTMVRGNLLTSVSGLKAASGVCFAAPEEFIIYEKEVNPKEIILSKLQFKKGISLRNVFGESYYELNLWVSKNEVPINVAPVEGKQDMYRVNSVNILDSGFYALHGGCLSNKETPGAFNKTAYDFVIGKTIEPYQSSEVIAMRNEQIFRQNAENLLKKMNDFFNSRNYNEIRKIYLNSSEQPFDDQEWNTMVEGFKNWTSQSGNIKTSQIVSQSISEKNGIFYLKTEYEKVGITNEELHMLKNENGYYITFIGTK